MMYWRMKGKKPERRTLNVEHRINWIPAYAADKLLQKSLPVISHKQEFWRDSLMRVPHIEGVSLQWNETGFKSQILILCVNFDKDRSFQLKENSSKSSFLQLWTRVKKSAEKGSFSWWPNHAVYDAKRMVFCDCLERARVRGALFGQRFIEVKWTLP